MLAVVDGLGHGPLAAEAATRALRALGEVPAELEPAAIVQVCDRALRGSRGAALTLVIVGARRSDGFPVAAVGVGNVALRARGVASLAFVPTPGVVGSLRRAPRTATALARPGARIVLASDGISARFDLAELDHLSPERACAELLSAHGVDHDDATALVADLPLS